MMAPEQHLQGVNILEESARIRDALLDIEERVELSASAHRLGLLEGVRAELGYLPVAAQTETDLVDVRITEKQPVISPEALSAALPVSSESAETTRISRANIGRILNSEDDRTIAIVGPCSIHDPEAALLYAQQVAAMRDIFGDDLEIVMRAYMEKPRTELGWKGFIYDPRLDESDDINHGVVATRMLAGQITHMGVPIAMERLNALTPQYVNGLVAYDAIGARNTTDQKAREYASGTSSPVGIKNTPEGSVEAAVQAVVSANGAHSFLGMGLNGAPNKINTTGNDTAHVILRGDNNGPNYSSLHIRRTVESLRMRKLVEAILVDASHGNSRKNANKQAEVIKDISYQIAMGQQAIKGVMIESNLVGGAQAFSPGAELVFGQSITDACSDIPATREMLEMLATSVQYRRELTKA